MVADQHLAALAAQLLKAEHVEEVAVWCPIITFLAMEAAAAVSPTAMAAFGVRDPRFYIKVGQADAGQTTSYDRPGHVEIVQDPSALHPHGSWQCWASMYLPTGMPVLRALQVETSMPVFSCCLI